MTTGTAIRVWSMLLLPVALAGCHGGLRSAQASFRAGDLQRSEATLAELAEKEGTQKADAVIVQLEYGSILHHRGKFEESTEAFLRAEQRLAEIDLQPRFRFTDAVAGLLTNPSEQRYLGTPFDRVMAPFYRGLNAMLAGDMTTPRQAFMAARNRQAETIAVRRKKIERTRRELAKTNEAWAENHNGGIGGGVDYGQTLENEAAGTKIAEHYGALEQYEAYGEFAVPVVDLTQAIYLLGTQKTAGDADTARALLRRLAGMVPDNPYVPADLVAADEAARGRGLEGVTYVLFAPGTAASLREIRINLPLFLVTDEVDYVGVAFPILRFHDAYTPYLEVAADEAVLDTRVIADMDRIVAAEFNAELPSILTRHIASAAAKNTAAWAVSQAADNVWASLALGVYQSWQNRADIRTWATLPKQYQYARVETPESGVLTVRTPDGRTASFDVEQEGVNFVYVRCIRPGRPLIAHHAHLK